MVFCFSHLFSPYMALFMNVVLDTRPATDLSDLEVCAYLVRAIRAQGLRTVDDVRQAYGRLFPDMPPERVNPHLQRLAEVLR